MALASPIDWAAVELALVTWVNEATDLPVIWAQQNAPQPVRTYAALTIIAGPFGFDDDDLRERVVLGDVGTEIKTDLAGQRGMTVSAQFFSDDETPSGSAMQHAARAQAALSLMGVGSKLLDANLAVLDVGELQNLSEVEESVWVSRAGFDVRLGLAANIAAAEVSGYIADTDITGLGQTTIIDT